MSSVFHITVAVAPPEAAPPDLSPEVTLVKAALLYGDRVALVSPAASLLRRLAAEASGATSARQRLDILASVADDLDLGDAPIRLRPHLGEPGIEATVERLWRAFRGRLDRASDASGLAEIAVAERAGALEIVDLARDESPLALADATADGYAGRVLGAVASGATHPLLDAATGEGLRQRLRALPEIRKTRARHVALAERLVQRLPLFDRATVAETLDVRADLDRPLARFRRAVAEFAGVVASGPWDPDFEAEAERVHLAEVAPAVADIEDAIASTGYLRELASRYADRPTLLAPLAAPALALAVAGPDVLTHAVGLAMGGLSVGANALKAWHDAADARRDAEAHRLFFYVAAGERFARGR